MVPFPSVEDHVQHDRDGEPSSSASGINSFFVHLSRSEDSKIGRAGSNITSTSDKLSALPKPQSQSPRMTRFSPSPSSRRQQRLSLDGDLLNFPSLHVSDFEISPLRKLKDKLESHTRHGTVPRPSASEGHSPPNGRVSVNSGYSEPTPGSRRQLFGRHLRIGSDPHLPMASLHSSADATDGDTSPDPNKHDHYSHSPSHSRSRGISPLRTFIHDISSGFRHGLRHHSEPEEPFIPINPFQSKLTVNFASLFNNKPVPKQPDIELAEASLNSNTTSQSGAEACDVVLVSSIKDCIRHANIFILDVFPRLIYLNLLLRLPALYFSRVARIFRDAEVSKPDIERMIEAGEYWILPGPFDPQFVEQPQPQSQSYPTNYPPPADDRQRHGGDKTRGIFSRQPATTTTPVQAQSSAAQDPHPSSKITPTLRRFKHSWEMFIDSILREWKTLNVVSALLASTIMTVFQIPDVAGDPVTRTAAILSLICALMSLTYGCIYIVRFTTMRSMVRASKWAEEARKTHTAILWNVWVLLAMPATWLAWSMVIFMVTILSFVWRTGSEADPPGGRPPLSSTAVLGARIAITFVVFIGVTYLVLILRTLKSYGMHGGNSQNILTSPQTHLGVLLPPNPVNTEVEVSQDHGRRLEAALESRGRGRTRSTEVRRSRRRETGPELRIHREEYTVPVQERFKEGNELGLLPVHSTPSSK